MEGEEEEDGGEESPEMVAGRLEIRVVSSPLPAATGDVNMTTTTLSRREEFLATGAEDPKLPALGGGRQLKGILKKGEGGAPGRVDVEGAVRRASEDSKGEGEEPNTPEVGAEQMLTANEFLLTTAMEKTEEFQSARGPLPDPL